MTCGGRTRCSTAPTSRRSTIRTATAPATSAAMTDRLEYLTDLGVTCLWLMPFYPTARKDDGYDITDFFGVDPSLGTLGDFVELVRTARSNGIRVIIDFVMNHTSDAAPLVQVRPPQCGRSVPSTTTSGARPSRSRARRTSCSPTRRTASGSSIRRPTSGTCTTSTSINRTSTSRIPKFRRRFRARSASGWSWASQGSGSMPCPSCSPRTRCPARPIPSTRSNTYAM